MKKILFFAATAMLFAACSSDEELAPEVAQDTAGAVVFDTYAASTTRAGDAGIQTTASLQAAGKGFGVFATQTDGGKDYAAYKGDNTTTNFMYNEHVTYTSSAWGYSPLKYWPNETANDSQDPAATSTNTDKLSFFAYAPYVEVGQVSTGAIKSILDASGYASAPTVSTSNVNAALSGILSVISNKETNQDPFVWYRVSPKPSQSVDLLWGVAPTGNLSYTAVNKGAINIPEYKPLIDLVKPAKDQKIKFLFKHALARLGLTVVAAADQIAPGGTLDTKTKIAIKSIVISDEASTIKQEGRLNLNNTDAGISNWPSTNGNLVMTIDKDNELAADLAYQGTAAATYTSATVTGVTTSEKTVIAKTGTAPNEKDNYFMVIPSHKDAKIKVVITYYVITEDSKVNGGYVETENVITKTVDIKNFTNNKAYNLKLILGMTSVKLDAEVADWQVEGSTDVNLPRNEE